MYSLGEAQAVCASSPDEMAVNELSSRQCCGPLNNSAAEWSCSKEEIWIEMLTKGDHRAFPALLEHITGYYCTH